MKYLLQRTDQGGGYIAPPGSRYSYTRDQAKARRFNSRDEAERSRCPGNEVIVEVRE